MAAAAITLSRGIMEFVVPDGLTREEAILVREQVELSIRAAILAPALEKEKCKHARVSLENDRRNTLRLLATEGPHRPREIAVKIDFDPGGSKIYKLLRGDWFTKFEGKIYLSALGRKAAKEILGIEAQYDMQTL